MAGVLQLPPKGLFQENVGAAPAPVPVKLTGRKATGALELMLMALPNMELKPGEKVTSILQL